MTRGEARDQDLARVLREAADAHQPDVEAMLRHVRRYADAKPVPARRTRELPPWARTWGVTGLVAAAVAAVVVAATTVLTPAGDPPADPAGPPPSSGTAITMVDARRVVLGTVEPRAVRLDAVQTRDWVVAGVQADDPAALVREDAPAVLEVSAMGDDPTSVLGPSPFAVDYDGGQEPSSEGRTQQWWQLQGPAGQDTDGLSVVAVPAEGRTNLSVWAGVSDTDGRVELLVDDDVTYTLTLPVADQQPVGYLLTVPLDDASRVELRLTSPAGGVVGFAAAGVQ